MKHILWIVTVAVVAYFLLQKPYPSEIVLFNQTFANPADQNDSRNELVLATYRSAATGDFLFVGKSEDSAITSFNLYERYKEIYTAQGYKLRSDGDKTIGNNGKATIYLYRSSLYEGISSFVTIDAERPKMLAESDRVFGELAQFRF